MDGPDYGFCHLYIGQEAVVLAFSPRWMGMPSHSYRDHGHMLACGMEARGVMAELTGRAGGYSRARAVRCACSAAKRLYGGHGIVATGANRAGIGFAHKYVGTDLVSVTYLGDGAINQGQVGEALNMAELWKLPVIFVIENNKYEGNQPGTRVSQNRFVQSRKALRHTGEAGRRHGCARGP